MYPLSSKEEQVAGWGFSSVDRRRNACEEIGFIPWCFATTQTLHALANVLKDYAQDYVTEEDFFTLFARYTASHYRVREDGVRVNWLDENLDPFTGRWLSQDILIGRIFGIEPKQDGTVQIRPMIPKDWTFCCLDGLRCQGHEFTVCWDATGEKYHKGKGLHVWQDGSCMEVR